MQRPYLGTTSLVPLLHCCVNHNDLQTARLMLPSSCSDFPLLTTYPLQVQTIVLSTILIAVIQVACPIAEKQSDQSNLPYSVMFRYSLCLIGQFGFLLFHDGTSNLKSTVLANLLLSAPPTASSQPLPLLAHSPSHCCPPPAIPLSLPLLLLFPSPCCSHCPSPCYSRCPSPCRLGVLC